MSETAIGMTASAGAVLTLLTHLNNGKVDDAIALFAEEFRFNDHGIGLEFKDKERLADFFRKNRELYSDAELHPDTIFLRGDRVVAEWTIRATLVERFFGGPSRKVPISARGFHRADREREDYGLGGLLRRDDFTAHRFGCPVLGMGRTLNVCGPQRPRDEPCPRTGLNLATRLSKENDED
jgi:steroid delta-isomerase-like uncharacterized protein